MKSSIRLIDLVRPSALAFLVFLVAASTTRAASDPLATLTIRNLESLQTAVTRISRMVKPDMPIDAGQELGKGLGLQAGTAFNPKGAWQVAVWFEGMPSEPLIALKVPTDDVEKFRAGLSPNGLLSGEGKEWTQLEGGYGLVTLAKPDALTEPQQTAFDAWKKTGVGTPGHMVHLTTRLTEPLRQQALLMLGFGKLALTQSFATNKAFAAAGANPKAMADLFGVYFEVIDIVVKGLDQFTLGLDLKEDALLFEEVITARPETDLAAWLAKPKGSIPAHQTAMIDPNALMSFAGRMEMDPSKSDIMSRFISLGFQIQNVPPEDPSIKELNDLMKTLFPMSFAGSVYSQDSMTFSGSYAFPESKAPAAYEGIKKFVANGMQSMVGKDKMYASAALQEKHRTLGGVAVDRIVLVLNTNSPLLSLPGQKEQMMALWPNSRMEFDYALKGDQLLFGSPDRLTALVEPASSPKTQPWGGKLEEGTVIVGTMNFVDFMRFSINSNPMLPPALKTQIGGMNRKGTEVEYRVSLNSAFRVTARVPVQLLREFSKINAEPPKKE